MFVSYNDTCYELLFFENQMILKIINLYIYMYSFRIQSYIMINLKPGKENVSSKTIKL